MKEFLADPSKFASAVAAPAATVETAKGDAGAPAAAETKAPEPEEESESEGDMGLSLFD